MVRMFIGEFGSGKEERAEKFAKKSKKECTIIDLSSFYGIMFCSLLIMNCDKNDVFILARSQTDLATEYWKLVDEYHIKIDGEWKVYRKLRRYREWNGLRV